MDCPRKLKCQKLSKNDLLDAEKIGSDLFNDFLKTRIESNEVNFYAPIKKRKLRTFDKNSGPKILKVKNKEVAMESDREAFARLLIIRE